MSKPGELSPARGDATRNALIEAAIEIFGRDGFDAAGTRAIAEAAGANQALIGYHFGGKHGLYLAALQHIADALSRRIGPLLSAVEAELHGHQHQPTEDVSSAEAALALLHRLTDAFVMVLTSEESGPWARLILREQQDPSEGFDILYDGIMGRVLGLVSRLVAHIRRLDASSGEVSLIAVTIIGQVLVFRAARAAVMRRLRWRRLGRREIGAIQERIRHNVTALLGLESSP